MSNAGRKRDIASAAALRERVVEAAGKLGWGPESISRFARALTGRAWEECGEEELREMLQEYEVLIEVVEAKRARDSFADRSAQATSSSEPASDEEAGLGRRMSWGS